MEELKNIIKKREKEDYFLRQQRLTRRTAA